MMATRTWIGESSDDATATGNYLEGVVPDDNDDVLFRAGANPCLSNVDFSAKLFTSLRRKRAYVGQIGSASSPFKCGANTCELDGGGVTFIQFGTSGSTDCNLCIITGDPSGPLPRIQLAGNITLLVVKIGIVTLVSGTIGRLVAAAYDNQPGRVQIENVGATVTLFEGQAGNLRQTGSSAVITTHSHQHGEAKIDAGAVTNVVLRGAHMISNAGGHTDIKVYDGSIDGSKDARARTWTTSEIHGNGRLIAGSGITLTNSPVDYTEKGGVIRPAGSIVV